MSKYPEYDWIQASVNRTNQMTAYLDFHDILLLFKLNTGKSYNSTLERAEDSLPDTNKMRRQAAGLCLERMVIFDEVSDRVIQVVN